MSEHRYYYALRPPDLGCQPRGFLRNEVWFPKRDAAHGWVEYAEPLTTEQCNQFDLLTPNQWERKRAQNGADSGSRADGFGRGWVVAVGDWQDGDLAVPERHRVMTVRREEGGKLTHREAEATLRSHIGHGWGVHPNRWDIVQTYEDYRSILDAEPVEEERT